MGHSRRLDQLSAYAFDPRTRRVAIATLAVLLFIGSFGWGFFAVEFINDHFWYLYRVVHLAHGELPYRDFDDPGMTLHVYTSFAVQRLLGHSLLGEALLCLAFIAAGTSLTFVLSTRISDSIVIGLTSVLLSAAVIPRLYNYPKVFLYVFGLLVLWRYISLPSRRNLLFIALTTVVAFLFRHDHGAYLAAAAVVTLVSVHWRECGQLLPRRLALYAGAVAFLLAPFVVFVAANSGLAEHFSKGIHLTRDVVSPEPRPDAPPKPVSSPIAAQPAAAEISVRWAEGVSNDLRDERERQHGLASIGLVADDPRGRTWLYRFPDPTPARIAAIVEDPLIEDTHGIDRTQHQLQIRDEQEPDRVNAAAWLNLLFRSLPFAALGLLCVKHLRPSRTDSLLSCPPGEVPRILGTAALCAVAAPVLLRDDPAPRLADLAGPSAVLGAWLIKQALGPGRPRSATRQIGALVALLLVAATAISIWNLGDLDLAVERTTLLSGRNALLNRGSALFEKLRASPPIDGWAPDGSVGIKGLTRYVYECTLPTDRVFVSGFAPDLYFFAERRPPRLSGTSGLESAPVGGVLTTQSVPIVIVNTRATAGVPRAVRAELETSYYLAAESGFGDPSSKYRVLVHRQRVPVSTYQSLPLPCFN